MKLSVIILAKEDDFKLNRAVESVSFADEVVVVKEKLPVKDFSKARNSALDRAKGEWVLFVDSDEIVSEELKEEIKKSISKNNNNYKNYNISGIYFRRLDRFLGKLLKYGETANVRLLRLAKKDAGRWVRPVHEVWRIKGEAGELRNPFLHYSHESVEEMVEKLDRYSEIEAEYRVSRLLARWLGVVRWWRSRGAGSCFARQLAHIANLPTSLTFSTRNFIKLIILFQLIFFPFTKFIQNYIFRLGFLDGMEGFIHAGMMSFHSFLVRAKTLDALMR